MKHTMNMGIEKNMLIHILLVYVKKLECLFYIKNTQIIYKIFNKVKSAKQTKI